MAKPLNKIRGFTLVEILVALFIFTILSAILVAALHHVIHAQSSAESHAERLRNLQMALLVISRDVQQTVNRPILNAAGKDEPAFSGSSHAFKLTHSGYANVDALVTRSSLQRTHYQFEDGVIVRTTFSVLDQVPSAVSHSKTILTGVSALRFYYLDAHHHFRDAWQATGEVIETLPRAVKVELTLSDWGTISQLFIIPRQSHHEFEQPT